MKKVWMCFQLDSGGIDLGMALNYSCKVTTIDDSEFSSRKEAETYIKSLGTQGVYFAMKVYIREDESS